MNRPMLLCSLLLCTQGGMAAVELDGESLQRGAQVRACYLGLFKMYEAAYYRSVVPGSPARCVQLDYLREFSAGQLDEGTRKIFEKRHGSEVSDRYRVQLQQVADLYEPVAPGDRYTYCVAPNRRGLLKRNGVELVDFESTDFARRFMQIWVQGEDTSGRPDWGFGRC